MKEIAGQQALSTDKINFQYHKLMKTLLYCLILLFLSTSGRMFYSFNVCHNSFSFTIYWQKSFAQSW